MKPIRIAVLLFSFSTCIRTPAAEPLPAAPPSAREGSPACDAIAAYRDGRPYAAAELARPLAGKGDADALFLLAFSLESLREPARLSRGQAMDYYYRRAEEAGHPEAALRRELIPLASGREKDRTEARAYLENAAAGGSSLASRILGEAWVRGLVDGTPDPKRAADAWGSAADAGDTAALLLLGHLHAGEFGFPGMTDAKAAVAFYRKAADRGESEALLPLAALLLTGDESIRDESEGRRHAAAALEAGHPGACLLLGDHEAQSGKNMDSALGHYRKGAKRGDHECMLRLARWYLDAGRDRQQGLEWLTKAAAGNTAAAAELGMLLLSGGKPAEGFRHLLAAAREGLPSAQAALATAYLEGKGCTKDECAAVAWLTEAMKSGDAGIQYQLATLHEQGIGTPVNYANAGVLYTMASGKGHAGATARIAFMAAEGLGTARNPVQARAHAALALELGDSSAKDLIAKLDAELDEAGKAEAQKTLDDLKAGIAKKAKTSAAKSVPSDKR